jgi:hypothetical protein
VPVLFAMTYSVMQRRAAASRHLAARRARRWAYPLRQ